MKFSIFQGTRQGPRPYNQDRLAYAYHKAAVLMVLADGMGGHMHGEVAADIAVKSMIASFEGMGAHHLPNPAKFLNDHIVQVHHTIERVRLEKKLTDSPRTTVVATVIQNNILYCAHVGDSRMYVFRNGQLHYKTEDHSVVQAMFRKGQISREEMATHPHRNKIYNCVGGDVAPQIELARPVSLEEGDVILLCSDGVWNVITEQVMRRTLFAGNMHETVTQLLNEAEKLSQTQGDNMSAIGLQWGDRNENPFTITTVGAEFENTTTMINPASSQDVSFSDEEIERALAEIQAALNRSKQI